MQVLKRKKLMRLVTQLKLRSFAWESSYPIAGETPYSTWWNQKKKQNHDQPLWQLWAVSFHSRKHRCFPLHRRGTIMCDCQSPVGPPSRAPTAPQASGVKLVSVTKQPVAIKLVTFRQVLPSCERTKKQGGGGMCVCVIMPLLQLCDKPG